MKRDPTDFQPHEPVSAEELKSYFAGAASWRDDRVSAADRMVRNQRWVIGGLMLTLLATAAAIPILLPLKTIETVIVRVDSSTGIVDSIVRQKDIPKTHDELATEYFIRKYVNLRENYTRNQIEPAYEKLQFMTSEQQRPNLREALRFANPAGPYAKFGESGTRKINIKSVARLGPNIMQVRFFAIDRVAGITEEQHFISTLEYAYEGKPSTESAREVTPFGFVVTSYRRNVEAVKAAVSTR
ncbi:MAG: virB8 family protein [Paracoccaceae bacterium]